MKMMKCFIFLKFFFLTICLYAQAPWDHGKLVVSENKRFIQHEDGTPFFYLGDTGWNLFKNIKREDVELYLEDRKEKGYTVIQAVALDEWPGPGKPNAYGDLPLNNLDPASPKITPGADLQDSMQYDYWDHVDWVIQKAAEKGMYIGLLPSWGNHVTGIGGTEIFTPENAEKYIRFIAERYKDYPNIIYISGGDRYGDRSTYNWNAIHKTLQEVDGDRHLKTFHPMGPGRSSDYFHEEPWMDFNMVQTGHRERDWDISYKYIEQDYQLSPIKPTMDGEPRYENHDINWKSENGFFDDYDVRQAAYWPLFAGAFGHTYGAKPMWYFGEEFNGKDWKQALDLEGAHDMKHVKDLIMSRPFFSRVPDQSLIVGKAGDSAEHMQATRGDDYAFVYFSTGQNKDIALGKISGRKVKAWWYNPRNGEAIEVGIFRNKGSRSFNPPGEPGRGNDWVLVLDDTSKNYLPPGKL